MGAATALRAAIDLMHVPSRARIIRREPLPAGVLTLLRIAAADGAALQEAAKVTRRPPDFVLAAAAFFIEQVLLHPDADSYRALGAMPDATSSELRRNMALLLKGLHPDLNGHYERSLLARRVTRAWNDLKTRERRAAYDAARKANAPVGPSLAGTGRRRQVAAAANAGRTVKNGALNLLGTGCGDSLDIFQDARASLLRRALLFLLDRMRS